MSRITFSNYVIHDQIDLKYGGGGRITGQTFEDITLVIFHNNARLDWNLSGEILPPSIVNSGTVYFYEISGSPGFYSVVFMPHLVGFFRVVISYDGQEIIREYDVLPDMTISYDTNVSFG